MKVNEVSSNNTVFGAKFIHDSKGILKSLQNNAKYNEEISLKTLQYADMFEKKFPGQELEILEEVQTKDIVSNVYQTGLRILNHYNGKTAYVMDSSKKPFWDKILLKLISDEKFYQLDTNEAKFFNKISK